MDIERVMPLTAETHALFRATRKTFEEDPQPAALVPKQYPFLSFASCRISQSGKTILFRQPSERWGFARLYVSI